MLSSINLIGSLALAALGATGQVAVYRLETPELDPARNDALLDALARGLESETQRKVLTATDISALVDEATVREDLGCEDVSCLAEIGGAVGCDTVVAGSVVKDGDVWRISVRAVDVARAANLNRLSLSWPEGSESLEEVLRLAGEMLLARDSVEPARIEFVNAPPGLRVRVQGEAFEDGDSIVAGIHGLELSARSFEPRRVTVLARPGRVVRVEASLEPSDDAKVWSLGLQALVMFPERVSYRSEQPGFGAAISSWGRIGSLALQPRLAFAYGDRSDDDSRYLDVSADFGAFFVLTPGRVIEPFIGGALGAKYLRTVGPERQERFGSVVEVVTESTPSTRDFGFNAIVRAGFVLFPESPIEFFGTVDYAWGTFGDVDPQSLVVALGAML
ncbi:MAG: hypothetical protein AAFP04_03130 [Myxococcota bacterium]